MNLRQLDLNLLLVLHALLKDRNVTAAAQRLGVSQSTVSTALGKLRTLFGDELFIKHAHGVAPTPRALALEPALTELLTMLRDRILAPPSFDPATSARTFTVVFGELGQRAVVPRLLRRLRAAAPHCDLRVLGGTVEQREQLMTGGEADIAVGLFPEFSGSGMFQQKLYAAHPLVCMARADHPALHDGLTPALFRELEHAVVGTDTGYPQHCETVLKRLGIERRVVVRLSSFFAAAEVLAGSDLITVVPAVVADLQCADGRLRRHASPVAFPDCEVRQFWPRRLHHDPAVVWLRQLIASEFQSAAAPDIEPVAPSTEISR